MEFNKSCLDFINHVTYIWKDQVTRKDIEQWFANFEENPKIDTHKMASDLLKGFIFYTEKEVKYLCRHVYLQYKQKILKEKIISGSSLHEAEAFFDYHLKKCVFSYIGNPGESGAYILYYFRQMNKLSTNNFTEQLEDLRSDVESLIFVDDFIGSGDTAIKFWKSNKIQTIIEKIPNIKIYYLALIGLESGIKEIQNGCSDINVICSQILDSEYKVFSESSYLFPEKEKRELSREVCYNIGNDLEGKIYALGYKNSELMIGFHHNIPNNTLPVIWSDNKNWYPIFLREKKIY